MKKNECGRTMVEMLGVLSIIGVISVGGFNILIRTQHEQKTATLISDIAQAAQLAKKLSCQFDDGYKSYSQFLYRSNAYPNSWTYSVKSGEFTGILDSTYTFAGNAEKFSMAVSNLDEEICIKIATTNWGNIQSSGLTEIQVNSGDKISSGTDSYPVGLDIAATQCGSDKKKNKITLTYTGCK